MAGERIGKTYEAIIKIALEDLRQSNAFTGNVFWNIKPEGLSVEPDFSIGPDSNHPTIMFMVTHSNASMKSPIKCWRNLGELCEAKTTLSPMPVIINIIFDAVIRGSVKEIQTIAFDSQLIIGEKEYFPKVKKWASTNDSFLPVDQEKKVDYILEHRKEGGTLKSIIECIKKDIEDCIRHPSSTSRLWEYERARDKLQAPTGHVTTVRRGLSKLLIFNNIDNALRVYRGDRVPISVFPQYAYSLGLVKKSINGALPADQEISGAVSLLDDAKIEEIYHTMDDSDMMQNWIYQIRNIDNISFMCNYIILNFDKLTNPDILYSSVIDLQKDANALVEGMETPQNWPPADVWLISIIIEIIKTHSGKANGYGVAQLGRDVIDKGYGSIDDLTSAGQFGGGFGFAGWMIRHDSPFKDELIHGLSDVLAEKLKKIGRETIKHYINSKKIEKTMIKNLMEAKICSYNQFNPTLFMLLDLPNCEKKHYRTCFAEEANLGKLAGVVFVVQVKHTIIRWQSATNAGNDHKRKELCWKAVGLRYTWDNDTRNFMPRPGIKKLILLLDGYWKQQDLNSLVKAGWDEIYFPDEMDKLRAAIV